MKVNSQKKVKTSQGFHHFFVSHPGVGFGKVLAVVFPFAAHSAVGFWKAWPWRRIIKKQLKTPHGCHVFSPVSLRYVFWKILAVETNSQKKLKRHIVFLFFCISFIQVLCFLVFFLV